MELDRDTATTHPDSVRPFKKVIPSKTPQTSTLANKPQSAAKVEVLPKIPASYASEVCFLLAVVCLTTGLVGFVADNFLSTRLGPLHSWLLLATAVAALIFGYIGKIAARVYCYLGGALYLMLAVAGFALGQTGATTFGSLKEDSSLWVLIPNQLAFGTNDHLLHLIIGAIFVAGASFKKAPNKSGVHY